MHIKIDPNKSIAEILQSHASLVDTGDKKYWYLGYWVEQDGPDFFLVQWDDLPIDLTKKIIIRRKGPSARKDDDRNVNE